MSLFDKVQENLNKNIWNTAVFPPVLKENVKIEILTKLFSLMPANLIKRVNIVGSLTGYQYNNYSDLDIQVVTIFDANEDSEKVEKWHQLFKTYNKNNNYLSGTFHPIHFYVMPDFKPDYEYTNSLGLYEILPNEGWRIPPRLRKDVLQLQNLFSTENFYSQLLTDKLKQDLEDFKQTVKELAHSDPHDIKKIQRLLQQIINEGEDLQEQFQQIDGARKLQYTYGWGTPAISPANYIFKYLENQELIDILDTLNSRLRKLDEDKKGE